MIGQRLATLDPETGERPESRIGHAGNARQLVNRLKYEDETRMYRYTRIQGLLDGNPPWPQSKLVDLGQGHRANFNLREGEGIVDSAKTPYYDLVFEVPFFAQITFDIPGVPPHTLSEWNAQISEEYYEILCGWSGFDQNIQLHQWQMIVNGVGPMFWPHGVSWRSEATKCRKVLVPQETKANVQDLEIVAVIHSWRADELESFIAGDKGKNDENYNGWNVPLCKQAIIDCAVRETRQEWGIENYDLYQRAIRTGDLFYGIHRSTRVYVCSLFIKEFGGKVSHYIITDQPSPTEGAESWKGVEDEIGYIYKKKNKYEGFEQVICPFFFDTGPDGTWHSVKGLGPKIYDFCDVSNRTFCQMLDGSVIGSGITLEAQEGAALEETQVALVGGVTVVQPGYKVAQTRIAESLNGAIAMRRELQNVLQSNTGSYRQRPTEEGRPEPTLGQAQLNYQQQALLSKGATNRYYNNLDTFHRETLRRLLDPAQSSNVPGGKEAKEFVARCVMRGIPEQILKMQFIRKVRSVRSLGYGSPQLRDMATKELIQMLPLMDEVSRNHALRARATALPGIGPGQVDSFFPKIEEQGVPNAHHTIATLENNALRSPNAQVLVDPSQDHSIHFGVHFQDVQKHMKDPNANKMELYGHMEQAGGHMSQHLQRIQNDPTRKGEIDQKRQALAMLSKQTDQLQQQLKEAAQAQARAGGGNGQGQQPVDPALLKVKGELALKAKKQEGDMALKARKAAFSERIKDASTASEIRRKNMEAGRAHHMDIRDMLREDMGAAHDIRQGAIESAHGMRTSAAESAADTRRKDFQAMMEEARANQANAAEMASMTQPGTPQE
jgi:hypothetical protein